MADAPLLHGRDRPSADVCRRNAGSEFGNQAFHWNGKETAEGLERLAIRAPIVEHAEHSRMCDPTAVDFRKESLHWCWIQVADDLRQVVLSRKRFILHEAGLLPWNPVRIRPATERQLRHTRADLAAQLPCVVDGPRAPDALVATKHDK